MAAIADDIAAPAPAGVRVIPVVGIEFSEHTELLQAIAGSLRGCFVHVSDPEIAGPVQGSPSAAVTSSIDEFLSLRRPGGVRKVRVIGEETLDVEFDDGTRAEAASPADRQVLALARTFLAHEVADSPLVFLMYDETLGMDRSTMRACWDFLVGGINGLSIGRIETVVALVNVRSINVGRHCRRSTRGFQFGVENDRLLRRSGEDSLIANVARVRDSTRPLVFFLGAGFSASSGLPLGNTLRDSTIRSLLDLGPDVLIDEARLAAFRRFGIENGLLSQPELEMDAGELFRTLTLEQVVRIERDWLTTTPTLEAFAEMNTEALMNVGSAVRELCRVLTIQRKILIMTVNFDTLVEGTTAVPLEVFAGDRLEDCAEYVAQYVAGDTEIAPYVKLHGTIAEPDTCVVTDDATLGGVPSATARALDAVLELESDLIYVGASMRDHDLEPVFRRQEVAARARELWVSPYLDDNVWHFVSRYRLRHWKGGVEPHVLTETADVFLTELASALT